MIAKASWFSPRKYSGWGLTPNCWQGWVYLAIIILPMALVSNLKLPGYWGVGIMLGWAVVFSIDFIDIMIRMKRDERDAAHEALAERNVMWFVIAALAMGMAYQTAVGIINQTSQIDPVIAVALLGAMVVKSATHFYLRDK